MQRCQLRHVGNCLAAGLLQGQTAPLPSAASPCRKQWPFTQRHHNACCLACTLEALLCAYSVLLLICAVVGPHKLLAAAVCTAT